MLDSIPVEERTSIASFRWAIPLGFTAFLTSLSLLRYHLYLATGWDLGFYEQGLWALSTHGPLTVSSWAGYPVLARSGAWILLPLAYPYRLLGPDFLLILQAFAYGAGFLYVMDLAEAWNTPWSSVRILGWVYLLSPVAWGAALFDFHPAFLAVPSLLASLAAAERGHSRAAVLWLALALLTQDLVALVVVLGGIALMLKGNRRAGLAAVGMGTLGVIANLVALHALDPRGFVQMATYVGPGESWFQQAAHNLVHQRAWLYLAWVLIPFLVFGVTRRSWFWLLPALMIVALNVGSPLPAATSPFTQYSILILPALTVECLAAQSAGPVLGERLRNGAMAVVIAFFGVYLFHQSAIRRQIPPRTQNLALEAALKRVPPSAEVYCQNFVAPRVANRNELHPILAATVFPAGAYVVLDTGHSTGLAGLRLIRRDRMLLAPHSFTRYSSQGVYVLQMTATMKGAS